jgi:hypothetical protein
VISVFVAAALTLPRVSKWRQPRRVVAAGASLAVVSLIAFSAAAVVKDRVATQMNASSVGTRLFGWADAPTYVSTRLDLGSPLSQAVELKDDPAVREAVSWVFQLQALIPRAVWPGKPTIDYGQRVSAAAYGLNYGQSSSTITTIGDTFVNFSMVGVGIASLLMGLVLALAERRIRAGAGLACVVLAAGMSSTIVGQESPLILIAAGLIRNVVVAAVLWLACQAMCRRFGLADADTHADTDTDAAAVAYGTKDGGPLKRGG